MLIFNAQRVSRLLSSGFKQFPPPDCPFYALFPPEGLFFGVVFARKVASCQPFPLFSSFLGTKYVVRRARRACISGRLGLRITMHTVTIAYHPATIFRPYPCNRINVTRSIACVIAPISPDPLGQLRRPCIGPRNVG